MVEITKSDYQKVLAKFGRGFVSKTVHSRHFYATEDQRVLKFLENLKRNIKTFTYNR